MKFFFVFNITIFFLLIAPCAYTTEELAEKTGKSCKFCHLDPSGGGELTKAGKDFLLKISTDNKDEQKKILQSGRKRILHYVNFIAGYLHILTAIFWFGTILYVHIVLKPSYASHGLPRGEVLIGLISMAIMAVTGTVLSIHRIPSISVLFETRFGILLMVKIFLFLVMVCSALYVVLFIGPKLRIKREEDHFELKRDLTVDDLMIFDGTEDRAAYIAYKGKIYDVTKSELWQNGTHFGKHQAGADLTEMLKQAPHGEEKILAIPHVGKLIPTKTKKVWSRYEKSFYFIAYMNLALVFLITLILALWRWW